MNELDLFMERLEREVASLTIPGFEYLVEAIKRAKEEVHAQRAKKAQQ